MGLLDLLQQFTGGAGSNPADHFDQVAAQASPAELGRGLAAAMRSDASVASSHRTSSSPKPHARSERTCACNRSTCGARVASSSVPPLW